MDPFEADEITSVVVPEPIRSAIHPVEVEEEDVNDENELTPGDENPSKGKSKSKFTSGFKNVLPFGKSSTPIADGETTQQEPLTDGQEAKSSRFTSGFKNVLSFGKSSSTPADDENTQQEQQVDGQEAKPSRLTSGFKNILPFGKSSSTPAQDGETPQQDEPSDGQLTQEATPSRFTSGLKSVFSLGKSDPAADALNESSTDPAEASHPWTDGIKNVLSFNKSPGQIGNPNEMLTNAMDGEIVGPVAVVGNNATANGNKNLPAAGPAAAAAGNKLPAAAAPQQDADFTIISDGFNNKKTLANGLMDFAFLTANANQLHYALTARAYDVDRIVSIVLISSSILLQIVAGVLLISGSYIQAKPIPINRNTTDPNSKASLAAYLQWRARALNLIDHWTIALVFMIAIINIFIAAFATGTKNTSDTNTDPDTPPETPVETVWQIGNLIRNYF
ncbi:hypothetical protein DAPPUDRAFT_241014 [Daphnia pulex]|uniref:Uncharacterized protein n=1 Tax=Daphnia pulex TaxID=6669 RepID=E9GD72_DAPPU|nr:hypothetical protein DAPPUDRAFT_241014 [Daphnia pulex]|eukprot:EFX82686.1 hypothetical protein DAPPUDRAFT_241014 [Daphnia pulex]